MLDTKPIAETSNFIVLDQYRKIEQPNGSYQSEADLERELVSDLQKQGYELLHEQNHQKLLNNLRLQLQKLNEINFSESEWRRFLDEYLDKPNENTTDKARKIHDDYIYDFVFDDGRIQNICLLDKKKHLTQSCTSHPAI